MNQVYLDSARLMTRVAPLVFVDDTFALKGGTAINLFVRDMPRLSVDLDLVFPTTLCREIRRSGGSTRRSASPLHVSRSKASRHMPWPRLMRARPSCSCDAIASKSKSRSIS